MAKFTILDDRDLTRELVSKSELDAEAKKAAKKGKKKRVRRPAEGSGK